MFNSFPPSSEDTELRLKTMGAVLAGISSEAICQTAERFVKGEVEGQSLRFSPSVPEFVQEARRRQELIGIRSRPKLEPPKKAVSPRVGPEKMRALQDMLHGRRSPQSVADEFNIKLAE